MKISTEINPAYTVVHVQGKIDAANCDDVQDALQKIIVEKTPGIILAMDELVYISSAGLRVLLSTAKAIQGQGRLILCGLNENIYELIEMSGFSRFMEICGDLDEARNVMTA